MVSKEISGRASAERLRVIRSDLLARIRPLCTAMPDDIFLEMIEGMAALQLKYELQDSYQVAADDESLTPPAGSATVLRAP